MLSSSLLTWQCDTYASLSQFEKTHDQYSCKISHYFRKQCLSVHIRLDSRSRILKSHPQVFLRQSTDSLSYKARSRAAALSSNSLSDPSVWSSGAIETDLKWRSSRADVRTRKTEFLDRQDSADAAVLDSVPSTASAKDNEFFQPRVQVDQEGKRSQRTFPYFFKFSQEARLNHAEVHSSTRL